jgi:hypothetical protein
MARSTDLGKLPGNKETNPSFIGPKHKPNAIINIKIITLPIKVSFIIIYYYVINIFFREPFPKGPEPLLLEGKLFIDKALL